MPNESEIEEAVGAGGTIALLFPKPEQRDYWLARRYRFLGAAGRSGNRRFDFPNGASLYLFVIDSAAAAGQLRGFEWSHFFEPEGSIDTYLRSQIKPLLRRKRRA